VYLGFNPAGREQRFEVAPVALHEQLSETDAVDLVAALSQDHGREGDHNRLALSRPDLDEGVLEAVHVRFGLHEQLLLEEVLDVLDHLGEDRLGGVVQVQQQQDADQLDCVEFAHAVGVFLNRAVAALQLEDALEHCERDQVLEHLGRVLGTLFGVDLGLVQEALQFGDRGDLPLLQFELVHLDEVVDFFKAAGVHGLEQLGLLLVESFAQIFEASDFLV